MGLVYHDYAVAGEIGICLELLKKHAVGQDLDACVDIRCVVKTHLVGAVVLRKAFCGNLALDV